MVFEDDVCKPDGTAAEGVRCDPRGPILVGKVKVLGDNDGRMPCGERFTQLRS